MRSMRAMIARLEARGAAAGAPARRGKWLSISFYEELPLIGTLGVAGFVRRHGLRFLNADGCSQARLLPADEAEAVAWEGMVQAKLEELYGLYVESGCARDEEGRDGD